MNHCFISYSNRDAEEFGPQLALELEGEHPHFQTWYDKRNIPTGKKWDNVIHKAIGDCKCFLFVVTSDSVAEESICMRELSLALSYKKPIFPLSIEKDIELPWRIRDFQRIDFYEDRRKGLAQLRLAIQRIDSPEGQLDALKDRLSAAERDLNNAASEEEKVRIQIDVDNLKKQIQVQENIVDNPKAAEDQTKKNIEAGLERERQPEKPVAGKTSTRFINPPPGDAPVYFQDRYFETEQIVDFLNNDAQRLMTIVGRAGIGKTATICRLLKDLERGVLPDDLGEFQVEGIVYLSEAGSHKINFANIFYDLCKLLPSDVSLKLDAIYKNPQGSTEGKTHSLLDHFQDKPVVLLLDNFEPLVIEDSEKFLLRDAELDEALRALLNGTHTAVKIIITTRVPPKALNSVQPGRQRVYHLEAGLEPKYAAEMLRQMDRNGILGLKKADENLLSQAHERTRGFPKALEALFQILSSDRYTTLEELLAMPTPENVVEALVGEAFNRLDPSAQKVMQALAVYNRPVSPAAIDYLLQPHLPSIDSALVLNRLVNMHFARREAGRYYLHPADKEYAFSIIPVEELLTTKDTRVTKEKPKKSTAKTAKVAKEELEFLFESSRSLRASRLTNAFTQHDLLNRAADYFAQVRKPRTEWKKLDDLSAQLAEFELRCEAGDFDTAANVLTDIDFHYLLLWGHYRLMIDLHEKLLGKISDNELSRICANNLGSANLKIGKLDIAIKHYELLLKLAQKDNAKQHESAALGNLGLVYDNLGDARKAIGYHEQALVIAREVGDRNGEGDSLGNLGKAYANLGDARKAIESYEQALVIDREIGDLKGEAADLNNIGSAYKYLGNTQKAIECQEQALRISVEIRDRSAESSSLSNLGNRYAELTDFEKAIEYYEKSILISQETGNRRSESICLGNIGESFLSLEEYQKARENYQKANQIADEISFPLEQQSARGGSAQTYLFQNDLVNAHATIEAALQYDVPQNNYNATALHGIIALRQGERETAQEAFAKSIAQADEILAKTPDYYDALDAKGLALSGLTILSSYTDRTDNTESSLKKRKKSVPSVESVYKNDAIETFKKARKIAPHAGVVKSVLRLFDELVKCDEEGVLKGVREAVEGKE